MNRRHFLKNTSQFTFALSLLPFTELLSDTIFNNSDAIFKPFFKLSLAQWSLHKAIGESKTLSNLDFAKTAKQLGFEGLEYVSQLYPLDAKNEKASLDKLVRELHLRSQDNGIQNVLFMVDNEGELAAISKNERTEAIDKHSKWVDAAAALNCHSIRVNLFGKDAENDFAKWKETAADGLGRLSEYAAKSQINVIVENHGGLSSDAGKLVEVIQSVNLKNCGTLPDFGNFCIKREGGERWSTPCIEQYDRYTGVSQMLPLAKGVSAKSYDFNIDGNETTIDYLKMLRLVKESGYKGFIGVEYEGSRLNEIDGILATKALLLKIAAQLQ